MRSKFATLREDGKPLLPAPPALKKLKKALKSKTKQLYSVLASDIPIPKLPLKTFKENVLMRYVAIWVAWLLLGMTFYANVNFDGNYARGFYYSVSIGYSIGWGVFHDKIIIAKVFSIFHILIGAIFVTRWIAYLIERAVADSSDIYEKKMIREIIRTTSSLSGLSLDIYSYIVINYNKLFIIYIWCVYIFFGACWSCAVIKWPVINGVYYSISSMSTAGVMGVPQDSPDYVFIVTGIFSAFGAPIMGSAVGNIASLILESRYVEPVYNENTVLKLNEDEMELLTAIRDGQNTGAVDRKEYVLLQLLKEDRISIGDVKKVIQDFTRIQEQRANPSQGDSLKAEYGNASNSTTIYSALHNV